MVGVRARSRAARILVAVLAAIPVLSASAVAADVTMTAEPAPTAECVAWAGETPLQTAVDENACVEVQPGTYQLPTSLAVGPGKELRGVVGGDPAATVLTPIDDGSWPNTIGDGVVNDAGSTDGTPAKLSGLTLDSNGISTYALCCRHFEADNVIAQNAFCTGIGIVGPNVTVTNSTIRGNGYACPNSPPGAGMYIVKAADAPNSWAPQIVGNRIVDNDGPGLDIAGVSGGRLADNTITGNASWAGVSLFGSGWTIEDNRVSHPATGDGQPYQEPCRGGPSGVRSAAIFLCQLNDNHNDVTVNNVVRNNQASGGYGILLIGNDEAAPYFAPRNNTITGNDVVGSIHGCADDFAPGQWEGDTNTWSGCDVTYF